MCYHKYNDETPKKKRRTPTGHSVALEGATLTPAGPTVAARVEVGTRSRPSQAMAGLALGTQSGTILAPGLVGHMGALQGHHAATHQQPGPKQGFLEPGPEGQASALDGKQCHGRTEKDRGQSKESRSQDLSARTRKGAEESEHGAIQTTGLQGKEIQKI